jgi:hypothetical protein
MKGIRVIVVVAAALSAGTVQAQGGSGPGPGPGPAAAAGASAPGMGPGMGRGPGARWGSDYTPGWSLMTAEERSEHQNRMREMKSHADCNAYMATHREQMAARAQSQGKTLPPMNRDACAGLKP